tara:strand:+ start:777 stop:1655 length:879 start_codon:yes stop_codon:yes gene_type:complete
MKNFQNILVITENIDPTQVVLNKALRLAQRAKANLTILVNKKNVATEQHLQLIYQQQIANPAMLGVDDFARPQFDVNIKYSTTPFSHQEVLTEISNHPYDLLIKGIHTAQPLWGLLRSDNHYLLREGNTNLLLVGDKIWPDNGHILAALETEETTDKHLELNQFMLDESQYLAQLLSSDVHLINCYQEQPSMSLAEPLFDEESQEPLQQHWRHLQYSAANFSVQQDHIHVEAGLPEYVIAHEAEKYQVDIVVLGAGEHRGLLGLLKGHTSEFIVNTLPCDALILKANMSNVH